MALPVPSSTAFSLIGRLRDEATRERAWQEFVDRYGRLLYHWCRQWGLQPSDAEDTAQDALLMILREIRDFEFTPRVTFRGWMRVVARNAWYNLVKGRDRQHEQDDVPLAGRAARDDLIERFEAMARDELLDRALVLVRRQADPLAWRAFEQTSLEHRPGVEVARELGQTTSWVYQARSRILKRIRQTVQALDREG